VIAELRADTPGVGDLTYIGIGTGSGGAQASLYYGPSVNTVLQFPNNSGLPLYATHAYRGDPVALPGVAAAHTLLTMRDDGASVGVVTTLGGQPYANSRRLSSGVPVSIRTASFSQSRQAPRATAASFAFDAASFTRCDMTLTFSMFGFIFRVVGTSVTVESDGEVVATHAVGATTITGTAGPLTTAQRRAAWEHIRGQEGGPDE
jgi:hypothetical protein